MGVLLGKKKTHRQGRENLIEIECVGGQGGRMKGKKRQTQPVSVGQEATP